MIQKRRGKSGI